MEKEKEEKNNKWRRWTLFFAQKVKAIERD